jgi:hypothetical protein
VEYEVKLWRHDERPIIKVPVTANSEMEAAALALKQDKVNGETVSDGHGLEVLYGDLENNKPITAGEVRAWLKKNSQGQQFAQAHGLQNV